MSHYRFGSPAELFFVSITHSGQQHNEFCNLVAVSSTPLRELYYPFEYVHAFVFVFVLASVRAFVFLGVPVYSASVEEGEGG